MENAPIFCKQKKGLLHVVMKKEIEKENKDDSAWFYNIF
jgi:hypothetical protein